MIIVSTAAVTVPVKDECRTDAKPIKWDYQTIPARKNLYDVYAKLLGLRQHFLFKDVFPGGTLDKDFSAGFKWMKIATDTSSLVVVGNFEVSQQTASISFRERAPGMNILADSH